MEAFATPLPLIRPISDMRTKLNDVCEQATLAQEPVILTKNGVPAYVLMDCKAYESAEHRARVLGALREAEMEERYRPESLSSEESDESMQRFFSHWGIDYYAEVKA